MTTQPHINFPVSSSGVSAAEREIGQSHPGMVIWFTGLSGAGKTTLASTVERALFVQGCRTCFLDGDKLRTGLCRDLGFSMEDRRENVRRVGHVAHLMASTGLICLTALISPFRDDRAQARALLPAGRFVEVFVNAPLAVCEQRDPKGLYRKARAQELRDFTGISSPYEVPKNPELEIRTDQLSIEKSVAMVVMYVEQVMNRQPAQRV